MIYCIILSLVTFVLHKFNITFQKPLQCPRRFTWQMHCFDLLNEFLMPQKTMGQAVGNFPLKGRMQHGCLMVSRLAFGQFGLSPEHSLKSLQPRWMGSRSQYLYRKPISSDCWKNDLHFIHWHGDTTFLSIHFWVWDVTPWIPTVASETSSIDFCLVPPLDTPKRVTRKQHFSGWQFPLNDSITPRHTIFYDSYEGTPIQYTHTYCIY